VDKTSKFLVARVMKTRTAAELNQASQEAFAPIPASHLKTFRTQLNFSSPNNQFL
jgi:hypothetical protein